MRGSTWLSVQVDISVVAPRKAAGSKGANVQPLQNTYLYLRKSSAFAEATSVVEGVTCYSKL